ncbi:MAG: RidA family protein [Candidatus Palauibacterales bacterium]|nr:RidA family protein [Candidatus Palauibacterales bacterium]
MSRREISTDDAPEAIGPYSQAILADGWLYTAGQIGLDPATGEFVEGGVEEQARRALANLEAVLEEAGLGFGDVVKTTVFLADMDDYGAVNEIYGDHFTAPFPARSAVEAATLPRDARVEIELVARAAG